MTRGTKVLDPSESRSIARALQVLEQLSVAPQPLTNGALAKRLKVPPSSMFRLLQKLTELGYVDFDESGATYGVAGRLGELGERLADAGCRSLPMRTLLAHLTDITGHNALTWVRSGLQVRLAAILPGTREGVITTAPNVLSAPFSTPGLAMALTLADTQLAQLVRQCRRRHIALGRNLKTLADVRQSVRSFRPRGHVTGYNMMSDGWATVAWPIPIPVALDPQRIGAVAVAARVPVLRSEEQDLLRIVPPLIKAYCDSLQGANRLAGLDFRAR